MLLQVHLLYVCTGNDSLVYVAQLYCKADKKTFFHRPTRSANIVETGHEVRFQAFLVVQTALLLSITYYLFTRTTNSGNDICDSPILAVGIFFGIFLSYFLLKKSSIYNCKLGVF